MKCSYAYLAAAALAVSAMPADAATQTFAQFLQQSPGARLFDYTNLDSGANKKAEITASGVPVYFLFGVSGLAADLTGFQDATLSVDFVSNLGTTSSGGASRVQLFDTVTNGSISFVRTSAAAEGAGTRTNLLTVSFKNAELDASQNNGSFTFKSNSNSVITYTSDFMNFSNVITKDFSLSFSGSNPTFQSPIGKSAKNMTFSGTGTFASDPAPITIGAPEASTWAMLVLGFGGIGALMRSGRRSKDLFAA